MRKFTNLSNNVVIGEFTEAWSTDLDQALALFQRGLEVTIVKTVAHMFL